MRQEKKVTAYADEDASTAEGTPQGLLEEERLPNEAAAKVPRHLQVLQLAMGVRGTDHAAKFRLTHQFSVPTPRLISQQPLSSRECHGLKMVVWLFQVACNSCTPTFWNATKGPVIF